MWLDSSIGVAYGEDATVMCLIHVDLNIGLGFEITRERWSHCIHYHFQERITMHHMV